MLLVIGFLLVVWFVGSLLAQMSHRRAGRHPVEHPLVGAAYMGGILLSLGILSGGVHIVATVEGNVFLAACMVLLVFIAFWLLMRPSVLKITTSKGTAQYKWGFSPIVFIRTRIFVFMTIAIVIVTIVIERFG